MTLNGRQGTLGCPAGCLASKSKKNHESKNIQPPGNGGLRNESNVLSPKKSIVTIEEMANRARRPGKRQEMAGRYSAHPYVFSLSFILICVRSRFPQRKAVQPGFYRRPVNSDHIFDGHLQKYDPKN
jgi:hypothetical protein